MYIIDLNTILRNVYTTLEVNTFCIENIRIDIIPQIYECFESTFTTIAFNGGRLRAKESMGTRFHVLLSLSLLKMMTHLFTVQTVLIAVRKPFVIQIFHPI